MRGLMRFLMMFGPMIFRQYQKYQRNQSRKQQRQGWGGGNVDPRQAQGRPQQQQQQRPPQRQQQAPVLSKEDQDFRMKEEEFMLDGRKSTGEKVPANNRSTEPVQRERTQAQSRQRMDDVVPEISGDGGKKDDGFNIKDIFFKD